MVACGVTFYIKKVLEIIINRYIYILGTFFYATFTPLVPPFGLIRYTARLFSWWRKWWHKIL